MKKRFFKIIAFMTTLGLILVLASCDIHLENLFNSNQNKKENETEVVDNKDDNKIDSTVKEDNKENDNKDTSTSTDTNTTDSTTPSGGNEGSTSTDSNTETVNEKTDEEELKIKDYALDYKNYYAYQKLGEVETYGEDLQTIYEEAYNQALVVLTSANDYKATEVNVIEGGSTIQKNYYMLDEIKINDDKIKTSSFTLNMAISAVMEMIYDNPLFYFLTPGYLSGSNSVYLTLIEEYATAEARTTMNNNILAMINDYKTKNDYESMTKYHTIESINKYIISKISYAKDSLGNPEDSYWAHNLEGFVNSTYNKGVCECYAKTCALLTNIVGIDSLLVTGNASSGGSTGGHAWNYVKINNKWYGLDVTWNDNDILPITNGSYFLVGSNKMSTDHFPYGSTYGSSYRIQFPTLETNSYSILA